MERIVFDTEPLLILFNGEEGAEKVAGYLDRVIDRKLDGYISLVNLTELYYILHRKSEEVAEKEVNDLIGYGVKTVSVDNVWKESARIKSLYSISLADSFAVATAKYLKASLIVGKDKDFLEIEDNKEIRIEKVIKQKL